MQIVETYTKPRKTFIARFSSTEAQTQWFRDNPQCFFYARILLPRQKAGEILGCVGEFESPGERAVAALEWEALQRADKSAYLSQYRKPLEIPYNAETERQAALKIEARLQAEKAEHQNKCEAKWRSLAKTADGRRQLADWRAEALELNADLEPGEVPIPVPPAELCEEVI